MLFAAHGIGFIKLDVDNPADSQVLIPARERDEIDWDMANRLATENRDFLEYVKLVKQFYQTGEARPADWDVPETGTDGLFQMADHVEAFISTLKRPEPAIARVGARAAHQQREPSQPRPLAVAKSVVSNLASRTSVVATDFMADSNRSSRCSCRLASMLREVTSSMTACLNRLLMVNAPWWVRMS